MVLVLVPVFGQLPWTTQPDVAVERLELEPGAARADRETEPVLRLWTDEPHWVARAEVPVERRDRDRDVGLLRHRHSQVAVMGREAVAPAVLDGPAVHDVAVDRIRFSTHDGDLRVSVPEKSN